MSTVQIPDYQKDGDHEKAIGYFDKALELEPDEALSYSNRSFSKLKLNDLKGAMNDIDKSLALMPINSYAHKIKGLILIERGKMKQACVSFHEASELGYTELYGSEVDELINKHCRQ